MSCISPVLMGKVPGKYRCHSCSCSYRHRRSLNYHLKSVHQEQVSELVKIKEMSKQETLYHAMFGKIPCPLLAYSLNVILLLSNLTRFILHGVFNGFRL